MGAGVVVVPLVPWIRRGSKQCSLVILACGCKAAKAELSSYFLKALFRMPSLKSHTELMLLHPA